MDGKGEKKKFMFGEALKGCEEAIEKFMTAPNGVYYRLVHDPLEKIDEQPASVRRWESMSEDEIVLSKTIDDSDIETQWRQVREYSPSYNVSDELLADFMLGMYNKRKTDSQKRKFIKNMGSLIVPVKLSEEDGMIQKDPETESNPGHVVFQPYEDFNLDEHIDWKEAKNLLDYQKKEI